MTWAPSSWAASPKNSEPISSRRLRLWEKSSSRLEWWSTDPDGEPSNVWRKNMNIDVHQHFIPQAYFDALASDHKAYGASLQGEEVHLLSGYKFKCDRRMLDPELRLRDMDRARVDVAAISLMPTLLSYSDAPETARRICTLVNDALVDMV